MIPKRFLNYISDMNTWNADGGREPQKPPLLLLALAREQAGKPRLMAFDEIEEKLQQVIEDFSPNRPPHPEYPFGHLRSEKIWEIPQSHTVPTTKSGSASRKHLRNHKIQGDVDANTQPFCNLAA